MDRCTLLLTGRCDLACRYCPVRSDGMADPARVLAACRQAAAAGARRFLLAGGEPLLLEDLPALVGQIKALPGVDWVGLATSGVRLAPRLEALKQAGLDGVELHLDACDAFTFTAISGKSQLLNQILQGIWGAVARDIPLTVTAVLLADNAPTLAVLAGLARQYDLTVRFVPPPPGSGEAGPDQAQALAILGRSIKGLTLDGGVWRAPGFKVKIEFGGRLWGAFGMEEGEVLRCDR